MIAFSVARATRSYSKSKMPAVLLVFSMRECQVADAAAAAAAAAAARAAAAAAAAANAGNAANPANPANAANAANAASVDTDAEALAVEAAGGQKWEQSQAQERMMNHDSSDHMNILKMKMMAQTLTCSRLSSRVKRMGSSKNHNATAPTAKPPSVWYFFVVTRAGMQSTSSESHEAVLL